MRHIEQHLIIYKKNNIYEVKGSSIGKYFDKDTLAVEITKIENEIKMLCPSLKLNMSLDDLRVVVDKIDTLQKMKKELKERTARSYKKCIL